MITLLRHAQSEHNVARHRVAGLVPRSKLTFYGRQTAVAYGQKLNASADAPVAIYYSPALRCIDTAKLIAKELDIKPAMIEDERLLEMDHSEVAGNLKLTSVINPKRFWRILLKGKNFQFKNGESFNHVADRMTEALSEAEQRFPDQPVLVVTHSMSMRCMLARKYKWSVWKLILKQVQNMEAIEW